MRNRSFVSLVLAACVVPVGILIIWQLVSFAEKNSTIFVSPYEGLSYFFHQFNNAGFYTSLRQTMWSLALGFALSALFGFAFGLLLGLDKGVERIANSLVHGLYSIPKVTLYPILLLFFGIGLVSQIAFVFIHGVFPMLVITMSAVGFIGKSYAKLAAANCLTTGQYLRKILLPAIIPSLVSALRICFAACFLSLILAELLGSGEGLGGQINKAITLTDMSAIVAIVIDVAIISIFVSSVLQQFEKYAIRRWGFRADVLESNDAQAVV